MINIEDVGLEPKSNPFYEGSGSFSEAVQLSIAISLKRIADAICGDAHNTGAVLALLDIGNSLSAMKDRP